MFLNYLNNIGTPEKVSENIFRDLGVLMKSEADLHLFKYSQIDAKWNRKETLFARGCILTYDISNKKWKYVSRPFDKFFNLSETQCPFYKKNIPEDAFLKEKADGSLIQVYFYNEQWKISTSGNIKTSYVGDSEYTFEELFKKYIPENFFNSLKKERTYMFELCSPYNIIVTVYSEPRIYFHGSRDTQTGRYFYDENIPGCINGIKIPLNSINSSINEFIEKELELSESKKYGKNPEGFVLYTKNSDGDFLPSAKIKSKKYLFLHRTIGGGDSALSRKNIKKYFYEENLDDIIQDIPEILLPYVEEIKEEYNNIKKYFLKSLNSLRKGLPYKTQKDYALRIQSMKLGPIQSLFFSEKEVLMENQDKDLEVFHNWIKTNYEKYGK